MASVARILDSGAVDAYILVDLQRRKAMRSRFARVFLSASAVLSAITGALLPLALLALAASDVDRLNSAITAAGSGATDASAAAGLERLADVGRAIARIAVSSSRDTAADAAAAPLARWLDDSRTRALASGTHPVPPAIRTRLDGFVAADLLDRVRFRVGWPESQSIAGAVFRTFHPRALTLVDVVVFRDQSMAADAVIWAHELVHVKQFARWGTDGFAERYARDHGSIEAEAWEKAAEFTMWELQKRHTPQMRERSG